MTVLASPEDPVAFPGRLDRLARHRVVVGATALSVLFIALVWLASLPTGTDSAAETVPTGSRLARSEPVADAEVLLVSKGGALSVQVAYQGPKGWLGAALPAAPTNTVAAWTGTRGRADIPALAAVYGRAPGASVVVVWSDARETTVRTSSDGVYLAVRNRYVTATGVRVLDDAGGVVLRVDGLSS